MAVCKTCLILYIKVPDETFGHVTKVTADVKIRS